MEVPCIPPQVLYYSWENVRVGWVKGASRTLMLTGGLTGLLSKQRLRAVLQGTVWVGLELWMG
jgi:hypothetical protein